MITKSFKVNRLPNQELSPNTRSHHMKKNREFQQEKERFEADLIYNSCIFDPVLESIELEFHFYPENRQVRDLDNLLACCKPWIDAMQQWVIPKDDTRYLKGIRGIYNEPVDEAYTEIFIRWNEEA